MKKYLKEVSSKINKFNIGYNVTVQDFYSMKEPYRETLSVLYSEISKKVTH